MKRCVYCELVLTEREELVYGDKCEDHAVQFGAQVPEVAGCKLLHDEEPDDGDYDLGYDYENELNFND
jgi:hypothetical protein